MTLNVASTELNRRLSQLIHNSVAADQFYIFGRSAFWRLVGLGLIALGMGLSAGIAFYGYSHIVGNTNTLRTLSGTLSKALSDVQMHALAKGVVQVEPREIVLAKGQSIALDANSRILLDPSSTIRADGEISVQAPSISSPQSISTPTPPKVPMITNFTKKVPFEEGMIMTGWVFLTSTQSAPSTQYCYYTQSAETFGNVDLDIAKDQKIETPKTVPKGFDMLAAFNRCVWFKSDKP